MHIGQLHVCTLYGQYHFGWKRVWHMLCDMWKLFGLRQFGRNCFGRILRKLSDSVIIILKGDFIFFIIVKKHACLFRFCSNTLSHMKSTSSNESSCRVRQLTVRCRSCLPRWPSPSKSEILKAKKKTIYYMIFRIKVCYAKYFLDMFH